MGPQKEGGQGPGGRGKGHTEKTRRTENKPYHFIN